MAANIVVVGSLNMDLIIRTDHLPRPGEVVIGGEVQRIAGGKGANQAAAAARLNGQVLMVGRVGRDENGEKLIHSLQDEKVDTAFISRQQDAFTGLAMIAVDSRGRNTTIVSPGANWQLSIDHVKEALDTIRRADLLILQLDIPNETIEFCADFAHRNGVDVMLNPAPPRALNSSLLANVRYLVMNEAEASVITETTVRSAKSLAEAAERLHAQGVAVVIISLGEDGAFYSTPAEKGRIPAFPVHTIDTTGAGDAFVGALAVATGNGRPILEAVRFASAAAALATKKRGGRPSLPYLSELEEFLIQTDV